MFERKLTSFRKTEIKNLLRDYFNQQERKNFRRITNITRYFGFDNSDDTYQYLMNNYNIEVERRRTFNRNSFRRFDRNLGRSFNNLVNGNHQDFTIGIDESLRNGVNNLQRLISSIRRNFGQYAYGRQVIMTIGNMNYVLNDLTLNRLYDYVNNNLVELEDTTESDGRVILNMIENDAITFHLVVQQAQNQNRAGGFFKYLNLTQIDMSRYGIFSKDQFDKVDWKTEPECLVKALEMGGINKEKSDYLKSLITDMKVPLSKLNEICDKLKIKIIVKKQGDNKELARNTYGKAYEETYNIGYFEEHFFINDETEYTSYSIKNYAKIFHLENFNKMSEYKKYRNAIFMSSFKMIETMFDNKLFSPISFTNCQVIKSQYYQKIDNEITDLRYNKSNFKRVAEDKYWIDPKLDEESRRMAQEEIQRKIEAQEYMESKPENQFLNVFFDFETHTDNENKEHTPYLCCCSIDGKMKTFFGEDCGLQMLQSFKKIKTGVRLIAHNASYDFRFIVKYLTKLEVIMRGSKMLSSRGIFKGKKIQVKCSYHLISMPLSSFPKTFGIQNIEKEVMPYSLYNTNGNVAKKLVPIDECLSHLSYQIEKDKFLENAKKWKCIRKGFVDIIKYSWKYCEIDVRVLESGYNIFKSWIETMINLNIDKVLTTASLAHKYFIEEGCYDDIFQFSGVPRMFFQKFVIGGRTMCSENKKSIRVGKVNDFDAVSLYPSAMNRMDGFLKGLPKIIKNLSYDAIKNYDGYFVEIVVKKVNILRKFPLMSFINENGVRIFTNDMIGKTLFVDKTTLEDFIQFQGIEFDIVRGYYFDEGFNPKIKKTISFLFNERNKLKKQGNKAEMIYKLLMNSGYGKSIMKPVEDEIKIFDDEKEKNVFINRNYNWVKEFTSLGNGKTLLKTVKSLNDHFNIGQVGVSILSMSKRIMNEVMCLGEDLEIDMFYQDTDSIHLYDKDIKLLSETFKTKYDRELIGKNMGQFHSDFDGEIYVDGEKIVNDKKIGNKFYKKINMTDVYAIRSVFLGKKCYIDELECVAEDGKKYIDYHIRMKGVPTSCVLFTSEKLVYSSPVEMYLDMYKGKSISFDLTENGKKDNFEMKCDYTITTKNKFERILKF
jgi:hypothetical protein